MHTVAYSDWIVDGWESPIWMPNLNAPLAAAKVTVPQNLSLYSDSPWRKQTVWLFDSWQILHYELKAEEVEKAKLFLTGIPPFPKRLVILVSCPHTVCQMWEEKESLLQLSEKYVKQSL